MAHKYHKLRDRLSREQKIRSEMQAKEITAEILLAESGDIRICQFNA